MPGVDLSGLLAQIDLATLAISPLEGATFPQ